jgi:hypothetical protein
MRLFQMMKTKGLVVAVLAGFTASIVGCAPDASTPPNRPQSGSSAGKPSPPNQAGSTETLDPTE